MAWLARLARAGVPLGGFRADRSSWRKAGLMDGRRMTVHWEHAAALAEISPHLLIERSLYVIDRDRVTCAGGTAPMDLMHVLITQHHGPLCPAGQRLVHAHRDSPLLADRSAPGLVERVGTNNPGHSGRGRGDGGQCRRTAGR
jgi:transcriptional regulator GlxA family with amidase domain